MSMLKVDKSMIIGDLIKLDENLIYILMREGMHCVGCPSSQMETLEEACNVHGMDVNELLEKIKDERIKEKIEEIFHKSFSLCSKSHDNKHIFCKFKQLVTPWIFNFGILPNVCCGTIVSIKFNDKYMMIFHVSHSRCFILYSNYI